MCPAFAGLPALCGRAALPAFAASCWLPLLRWSASLCGLPVLCARPASPALAGPLLACCGGVLAWAGAGCGSGFEVAAGRVAWLAGAADCAEAACSFFA